jgi:SAM-dependent methyltransferase
VRSGYDRIARAYAAEFADELTRKPFDREVLADFAILCGGAGVVCDLGCGPGHITRYLADLRVDVVGLDLSNEMVRVARDAHGDLAFVQGDAQRLPFRDGGLAGIVAFYSLIHLSRAELPGVLAELRRALAHGGILLVAVHAGGDDEHVDTCLEQPVGLTSTLIGRDELAGDAEQAGLVVMQAVQRPPYAFEQPTVRAYLLARKG